MGGLLKDADVLSPHWPEQAACKRATTITVADFFYEGRFRNGSQAMRDHIARLRAMCNACPVQATCDRFADEHDLEGFWAGLTAEERRERRESRAS